MGDSLSLRTKSKLLPWVYKALAPVCLSSIIFVPLSGLLVELQVCWCSSGHLNTPSSGPWHVLFPPPGTFLPPFFLTQLHLILGLSLNSTPFRGLSWHLHLYLGFNYNPHSTLNKVYVLYLSTVLSSIAIRTSGHRSKLPWSSLFSKIPIDTWNIVGAPKILVE